MECDKCREGITKDSVKCPECPAFFHEDCIPLSKKNKKWKCEKCIKSATSSGMNKTGDREISNETILNAINEFRKETNKKWEENNEKWEGMKKEFKDVKDKCNKTCDIVSELEKENASLKEELKSVKQNVQDLQQQTRKNNILISGVPVTYRENLLDILGDMARVFEVNFYHPDISAAHRLGGKKTDNKPPSIVVNFTSRLTKDMWLAARRYKGKLYAKDLNSAFPETPIYMNEHLTPETKTIFNAARNLMKNNKLSAVWTSDCKIMAKESAELRPFRVRDLAHVESIASRVQVPSTPPPTCSQGNPTPPAPPNSEPTIASEVNK